MTLEDFTAGDGYRFRYRRYAVAEPRGQVIAIHGIQSHGGWYEHSCAELCRAGFRVSFLDRRGSGLNEADRGDAPSFRRLLDDLAEFLRQQPPAPRRFLVAVSWGGKLAAALPRRHPGLIDGLALLCPGFFPRVKPRKLERLHIALARLVRPGKRFAIPLSDPELFTATPHGQRFIADDALGLRQATARFLVESVRLDAYVRRVPSAVTVPVLLMLAGQDRIIDNSRTRRFVESFASVDKQIIEYPEAHHTLEFEPEPANFIGDLRAWLEGHVA